MIRGSFTQGYLRWSGVRFCTVHSSKCLKMSNSLTALADVDLGIQYPLKEWIRYPNLKRHQIIRGNNRQEMSQTGIWTYKNSGTQAKFLLIWYIYIYIQPKSIDMIRVCRDTTSQRSAALRRFAHSSFCFSSCTSMAAWQDTLDWWPWWEGLFPTRCSIHLYNWPIKKKVINFTAIPKRNNRFQE